MRRNVRTTRARISLSHGVSALALTCAVLTASCVTHVPGSVTDSRAAVALAAPAQARAIARVGMTVADVARSSAFFTSVLDFEKVSDLEVSGPEYDRLWGVPGVRAHIVRLRLGDQ